MNTKILSRMAFVLFAGICMAGCSSDGDDIINKELPIAPENKSNTIVLTGTLSMGEIEGTTRAVDANGTFYWKEDEIIAVRYKKIKENPSDPDTYMTASAHIGRYGVIIQGGNKRLASFSVTLSDVDPEYGVRIAYPYERLDNTSQGENSTEDFSFDTYSLYNSQDGTIETISAEYSWAKTAAPVGITVSDGTATLNNNAVLVNQNAICKFNLTTADGTTALKASQLEITLDNDPTYIINLAKETSECYVAMEPLEGRKIKLTAHYTGGTIVQNLGECSGQILDDDYLSNPSDLSTEMMIGTVNPAATTPQQAYLFSKDAADATDSHQFGSKTKLLAGKFYTQTVKFDNVLIPIAVVAHVGAITSDYKDEDNDYTSEEVYCTKFLALAVTDATADVLTVSAGKASVIAWVNNHKMILGGTSYTEQAKIEEAYDNVVDNIDGGVNTDYTNWISSASRQSNDLKKGWRVPTVTDWRYVFASLCNKRAVNNPIGIGDHNAVYPKLNGSGNSVNYDQEQDAENGNYPVLAGLINEKCGNSELKYQFYWTGSGVEGKGTDKIWRYNFAGGNFVWTETMDHSLIRLVFAY